MYGCSCKKKKWPSISLYPSFANFRVISFTIANWRFCCFHVPELTFIFSHSSQLGTIDDDNVDEFYKKSVSLNKQQCQVLLRLTLRRTGCFRARISYKDQPLSNGEFDIIVLNGEQLYFSLTCHHRRNICKICRLVLAPSTKRLCFCIFQRMRRPVWRRTCPPRASASTLRRTFTAVGTTAVRRGSYRPPLC